MNCDNGKATAVQRAVADPTSDLRLAAARRRLRESADEEDAIEGLREIVANLLGSEEIGLFTVDGRSGAWETRWSFGIELEAFDFRRVMTGAAMERLMGGECHLELANPADARTRARAFIPLRMANRTVAVLAILRLLPQKADFDAADMELFRLLSNEAGERVFGRKQKEEVKEGSGRRV